MMVSPINDSNFLEGGSVLEKIQGFSGLSEKDAAAIHAATMLAVKQAATANPDADREALEEAALTLTVQALETLGLIPGPISKGIQNWVIPNLHEAVKLAVDTVLNIFEHFTGGQNANS